MSPAIAFPALWPEPLAYPKRDMGFICVFRDWPTKQAAGAWVALLVQINIVSHRLVPGPSHSRAGVTGEESHHSPQPRLAILLSPHPLSVASPSICSPFMA